MEDSIKDAANRTAVWEEQAIENVEKWGLQDIGTLVLAIAEESGEVAADTKDVVEADTPALATLLDVVESSGLTVRDGIERVAEDEDGTPKRDRPTFTVSEDADLEALRAEVDDLGALLIQLQTALEAIGTEKSKH